MRRLWIALLAMARSSPRPDHHSRRALTRRAARRAGRGARSAVLHSVADGGSGRGGDERDGRRRRRRRRWRRGRARRRKPLARRGTAPRRRGADRRAQERDDDRRVPRVPVRDRRAAYIPSLRCPDLEAGDQLAVEKVSKWYSSPRRNDVVVFNPPAAFRELFEPLGGGKSGGFFDFLAGGDSSQASEALIKRVVAVEGDTVRVADGTLYVNGVAQEERRDRPARAPWGLQQVPAAA